MGQKYECPNCKNGREIYQFYVWRCCGTITCKSCNSNPSTQNEFVGGKSKLRYTCPHCRQCWLYADVWENGYLGLGFIPIHDLYQRFNDYFKRNHKLLYKWYEEYLETDNY